MTVPNIFAEGSNWESVLSVSPPPFFDPDIGFTFSTDGAGIGDRRINFIGDYAELPGTYLVPITLTNNPSGTQLYLVARYTLGVSNLAVAVPISDGSQGEYGIEITLPNTLTAFSLEIAREVAGSYVAPLDMDSLLLADDPGLNGPAVINGGSSDYDRQICYNAPVDYNNGLFADPRTQTLAQLRRRLMVRLGYAASLATPPPGMHELLDDFINSANIELYERYSLPRLRLWFTWKTQIGEGFYDVPIDCTKYLDLRHTYGAWLQDDDAWFPLVAGINPLLYNQTMNALPQYYELRSTIELWPRPDKEYLLHLKGEIGSTPMTAEDDVCTVDSQAVFLHALLHAKKHYGQPDWNQYEKDLEILIGNYTAGTHYSQRYIPNKPIVVGLPRPIRQLGP